MYYLFIIIHKYNSCIIHFPHTQSLSQLEFNLQQELHGTFPLLMFIVVFNNNLFIFLEINLLLNHQGHTHYDISTTDFFYQSCKKP